jgi:hypothetical protein
LIKTGGYSLVYDFENLFQSANKAAEEKKYKNSVLYFFNNLEENIIQLQNELIWKEYNLGNYHHFIKHEPKRRDIAVLPFRDRVVQMALWKVVGPEFEKHFIYDTYSGRKNKGTLAAANRLSYFLGKPDTTRYLKCDVKEYFKSINIENLQKLIKARYVEDEDILWLINKILIHEYNNDGIKIGNSFSQLAANVYLGELDFYLKVKQQIPYFLRYMDDIIFLDNSVSKLKHYLFLTENFLENNLFLKLNNKTKIDYCRNGIDFVGYRVFPKNKIIKKQSLNRTRNIFKAWRDGKISDNKFLASIGSRCGHAKGTSSYQFYIKVLLKSLQIALSPNRKVLHS